MSTTKGPVGHLIVGDAGLALTRLRFGQLGFAFREKATLDFGVDAEVEIINEGRATGQLIGIQIKSGDSAFKRASKEGYNFSPTEKDLVYWGKYRLPMILVLANPKSEECYWCAIDSKSRGKNPPTKSILVPLFQILADGSADAIKKLALPLIEKGKFGSSEMALWSPSGGTLTIEQVVWINGALGHWTPEKVEQLLYQATASMRTGEAEELFHRFPKAREAKNIRLRTTVAKRDSDSQNSEALLQSIFEISVNSAGKIMYQLIDPDATASQLGAMPLDGMNQKAEEQQDSLLALSQFVTAARYYAINYLEQWHCLIYENSVTHPFGDLVVHTIDLVESAPALESSQIESSRLKRRVAELLTKLKYMREVVLIPGNKHFSDQFNTLIQQIDKAVYIAEYEIKLAKGEIQ